MGCTVSDCLLDIFNMTQPVPILHCVTWYCTTLHLGKCLVCWSWAWVGRTYSTTETQHLYCGKYKECHPHNTVSRSNTVPHQLVGLSHKSWLALQDTYIKDSMHLARWTLRAALADFRLYNALTITAVPSILLNLEHKVVQTFSVTDAWTYTLKRCHPT